jgi:hypothetical protein
LRGNSIIFPEAIVKVQRELTHWPEPEIAVKSPARRHRCTPAELPRLRAKPQRAERLDTACCGYCARCASGQNGLAQGHSLVGLIDSTF